MKSTKKTCELCSQVVEIKGFRLKTKKGVVDFCCEGCLSIYQLLNQEKLLTTHNDEKKK